jgi:hypothetical protein
VHPLVKTLAIQVAATLLAMWIVQRLPASLTGIKSTPL